MSEITIFNSVKFGAIRTALINNEPYFMLADVCRVLEINNPRQAKTRLNPKGVITNDTLTDGGNQQATFINESNLYKLAFTSRKAEAEIFTDWVTSEVLPSIRKYGTYSVSIPKDLPTALIAYARALQENEQLQVKVKAQTQQIAEFKPIKEYVDLILQSKETLTITQIAADYGLSAKALNKILHEEKIQHKVGNQWILYTHEMNKGYTKSQTHDYERQDGSIGTKLYTKWTQKGRLKIHDILTGLGYIANFDKEHIYNN